jgi:AcrR family transcriptional regulator
VDGKKRTETQRSLELLWRGYERGSRGPKPALDVRTIVNSAIEIADSEGIAAVSMQRVAKQFGFTPMSLYRYVPGKTELIDLMIDFAIGPPPTLVGRNWREKITQWAQLTLEAFQRHPWLLPTATARMPSVVGPNQTGWLDAALAATAETGLRGAELLEAVLLVNGHVRSLAPFSQNSFDAEAGAAFAELLGGQSERFPALAAAAADGAFQPTGAPPLAFGLARIFDGIEALVSHG